MSKRLAVVCLVGCFVLAAGLVSAEDARAPYDSWAAFKAGSFVKFKVSVETVGVATETEMTYTLRQITADQAVIDLTTTTMAMGMRVDSPPQSVTFEKGGGLKGVPQGVPGGFDMSSLMSGTQVAGGTETLDIGGQSVEATKYTVSASGPQGASKVVAHYSESVPGGLVKAVTEAGGMAGAKVNMVAVAFKAVQ